MPQLPQLFTNVQLADIVDNDNAHWVFPSLGRDEIQRNNRPLYTYIDSLVRTNINEDVIINGRSKDFFFLRGVRQSLESIKGITTAFIEAQSFEWLHSFYKWLSETKHRKEIAVTKPVFLDQNRHAVAAFHRNHHFDTRKRLHPLMHPLNTGDASPSIRALDQATLHFMDNCRVVFSFTKKEISTRQGQYLFPLIISHLSSIKATN